MSYEAGNTGIAGDGDEVPKLRLLDEVRRRLRVKHYSLRTETVYVGWIKRFILANGKRHPREMGGLEVEQFLSKMYKSPADFVWSVTRDFVKQCTTPVLILPDDIPAHPYKIAMEAAMLAPNAEVSMFPWKEPKEPIPLAIRQIRSFLRAHKPTSATA